MSREKPTPREPKPLRSFFERPVHVPPLPTPPKAPPPAAAPDEEPAAEPVAAPIELAPVPPAPIRAPEAPPEPPLEPARADAHVSIAAWENELPESLVICCSDGRYHAHFEEYVRAHLSERPDMIALPGGPAGLDGWGSTFDHERVLELSLRLMIESHRLRAIWLIAHADCAFYAHKHPGSSPAVRLERQYADLRTAKRRLLERWPALTVHCVYAEPRGGRVVFNPAS
ncbi:MAG: hypothetical protein EPO68_01365 [Planctomycetota bacterium]|nr:MAG: hypothetical protein EPO68_01365 [Planctomycetota bacterium]